MESFNKVFAARAVRIQRQRLQRKRLVEKEHQEREFVAAKGELSTNKALNNKKIANAQIRESSSEQKQRQLQYLIYEGIASPPGIKETERTEENQKYVEECAKLVITKIKDNFKKNPRSKYDLDTIKRKIASGASATEIREDLQGIADDESLLPYERYVVFMDIDENIPDNEQFASIKYELAKIKDKYGPNFRNFALKYTLLATDDDGVETNTSFRDICKQIMFAEANFTTPITSLEAHVKDNGYDLGAFHQALRNLSKQNYLISQISSSDTTGAVGHRYAKHEDEIQHICSVLRTLEQWAERTNQSQENIIKNLFFLFKLVSQATVMRAEVVKLLEMTGTTNIGDFKKRLKELPQEFYSIKIQNAIDIFDQANNANSAAGNSRAAAGAPVNLSLGFPENKAMEHAKHTKVLRSAPPSRVRV